MTIYFLILAKDLILRHNIPTVFYDPMNNFNVILRF